MVEVAKTTLYVRQRTHNRLAWRDHNGQAINLGSTRWSSADHFFGAQDELPRSARRRSGAERE